MKSEILSWDYESEDDSSTIIEHVQVEIKQMQAMISFKDESSHRKVVILFYSIATLFIFKII